MPGLSVKVPMSMPQAVPRINKLTRDNECAAFPFRQHVAGQAAKETVNVVQETRGNEETRLTEED